MSSLVHFQPSSFLPLEIVQVHSRLHEGSSLGFPATVGMFLDTERSALNWTGRSCLASEAKCLSFQRFEGLENVSIACILFSSSMKKQIVHHIFHA